MTQPGRIDLFSFSSPRMRVFHCSWVAFFLCFFGWFGLAPLMGTVRADLGLTRDQVANTVLASVAATIVARLLFGWLCDRIGPRTSYSLLLVFGSLPVMGVGLAEDYLSFLAFRLAIGVVGASFVITQYHTSRMFAPECVGTANATTAGWGNLGGGVTNMVMPLALAALVGLGCEAALGWRLAMVLPGLAMLGWGVAYYLLTTDPLPLPPAPGIPAKTGLLAAARDHRVWTLALVYGACFGVELTINNWAALYFQDHLGCAPRTAGLLAGMVGVMNIGARSLGGWLGDRCGGVAGLRGRALVLGAVVLLEGLALVGFGAASNLAWAVACLVPFGLCVCMACGATFAVVPFIDRRNLGAISGLVGAGGNLGALAAGLLFKVEALGHGQAFMVIGAAVAASSLLCLTIAPRPVPAPVPVAATSPAGDLALAGPQ